MNVYALGELDGHNRFMVKRVYMNKEDAEHDIQFLKNTCSDECVIREMPLVEEKTSNFYTVEVGGPFYSYCYIEDLTNEPIIPVRTYYTKDSYIRFSLCNDNLMDYSDVKKRAREEARKLTSEIDNDVKRLVVNYLTIKFDPHYESKDTINLVSTKISKIEAFEFDLSKCKYSDVVEKSFKNSLELLSAVIGNLTEVQNILERHLGKKCNDETLKAIKYEVERVLRRYHLLDKDNTLTWLIFKVIDGEDIFDLTL